MSDTTAPPPRLPARYRSPVLLGGGGMGLVYRAFDERLQREVAVKALRFTTGNDLAQFRRRFVREARVLAGLRHPNILRLLDLDDGGDTTCLVFEYLAGTELQKLADGPMATEMVVSLMASLAEGLDVVHEAGVLHRDIKPANVIVTEDGVPVLIDFGLTLALNPADDESRLTRTDCIVGTPGYIAPEVLLGAPHTPSSDVFQLGAVFYELLADEPLMGVEQFNRVLQGEPFEFTHPYDLRPELGMELADLVARSVDFVPGERPSRPAELAIACRSWLAEHRPVVTDDSVVPLATAATSPVHPVDEESGRHYAVPVLVLCFLALLTFGVIGRRIGGTTTVASSGPLAVAEVTADGVVVTGPSGAECRVVDAATKRIVGSGSLVDGRLAVGSLQPATDHLAVAQDGSAVPFTTEPLVYRRRTRALALGGTFCLDVATNLTQTELTLALSTTPPVERPVGRGSGRVVVADLAPSAGQPYEWRLLAPYGEVERGRVFGAIDVELPVAVAMTTTVRTPFGEGFLCADRYGTFARFDVAPPVQNRPEDVLMLRTHRGGTPEYHRKQVLLTATTTGEVLVMTVNGSNRVECRFLGSDDLAERRRNSFEAPCRDLELCSPPVSWGGGAFVQAHADDQPCWFAVDGDGRPVGSLQRLPEPATTTGTVTRPKVDERSPMGVFLPESVQRDPFLAAPLQIADRIFSLVGRRREGDSSWVEGRLYGGRIDESGPAEPTPIVGEMNSTAVPLNSARSPLASTVAFALITPQTVAP